MAYGWQQDSLAENAREIQRDGALLYQRLAVLGDHFSGVGKGLNSAVAAYNKAVGSLEGRVLVTARRFAEKGVVGVGEKELPHPVPVDAMTRPLQSPELSTPVLERPHLLGLAGIGDEGRGRVTGRRSGDSARSVPRRPPHRIVHQICGCRIFRGYCVQVSSPVWRCRLAGRD